MLNNHVITTNKGQTLNLVNILEGNYNLNISSITNAPRQFVASTFFIETTHKKYFCKVIDKTRFIPRIIKSLPPLENLHQLGCAKIAHPIPTISGELHLTDGDILIVLFNYINAPPNYTYDNFVFGQTLAEIHALTAQLSALVPIYTTRL
jgi:hypothetical protein